MENRTETLEPTKTTSVKVDQFALEFNAFTPKSAQNIEKAFSLDEIMAAGVKVSPVVRETPKGKLYLIAEMNGQRDFIAFSKKLAESTAAGTRLNKNEVEFYVVVNQAGDRFMIVGRKNNGGSVDFTWD